MFTSWKPAGIITGLLKESGVFDTTPLHNYLQSVFDAFGNIIRRKFVVSCADVNTGNYITFNETVSDPAKSVLSSSSIPFVFPHQVWKDEGYVCMDGGTVYNTNLVSAVQRCREMVDDDSEITIDIIICGGGTIDDWEDQGNAVSNYLRYRDINSYHNKIEDVYNFKQAFPKVNFRYYLQPSTPLPGGLAILNFDNSTFTYPVQMQGRLDGENAVKDGEGYIY